ncbi:MAG: hypothetical protein HN542_11365 [Flavobacteriales bacterium]|nr:hypothetical protein [Flavobacteriales bacterium]MBT3964344.1 hypothetical protein [Flavobacteriales bacterium]MBT4704742.1 hypothetical protein [Flavobacteriales bacterium]MBT4931675.1 hypothetical protein [Flavobacteriales bacterium]MBT5133641.1 hypothetical protein [Flavobacteriales bacterium]
MHSIEPYFNWRNLYTAEEDFRSPFHGRAYSEVYFTDAIYDHLIHPQWDNIGSSTLFVKILFAEYEDGYAIIELLGEWNDTLYNDVMTLKREVIDILIDEGINKFVLIGDNVLSFHSSDDSYYEEWFDDIEDGWVVMLNFRQHILDDFKQVAIDNYFISGGPLNDFAWGSFRPMQLFQKIAQIVERRFDVGYLIEEQ